MGHFKGRILLGRPDTVSYRKHEHEHDTDKDTKWVVSFGLWRYTWRYVATLLGWIDFPFSCSTVCHDGNLVEAAGQVGGTPKLKSTQPRSQSR